MHLRSGFGDEYKRRHDNLWPELRDLLKTSSISEYSIFLDETTYTLFGFMHVDDNYAMEKLPEHPVMKKWWAYMRDIMDTNPDNSPVSIPLEEVFYLP